MICSNDPGLTLTYFMPGSNLVTYAFVWEKVKWLSTSPPMGWGTKVCLNGPGHMTKMATMTIYGKNPSKTFFSGTSGPIALKLGMQHLGLWPFIICSNDDPGMALSYFMPRSNLVSYVFVGEKVKFLAIGPIEAKLHLETPSDKGTGVI